MKSLFPICIRIPLKHPGSVHLLQGAEAVDVLQILKFREGSVDLLYLRIGRAIGHNLAAGTCNCGSIAQIETIARPHLPVTIDVFSGRASFVRLCGGRSGSNRNAVASSYESAVFIYPHAPCCNATIRSGRDGCCPSIGLGLFKLRVRSLRVQLACHCLHQRIGVVVRNLLLDGQIRVNRCFAVDGFTLNVGRDSPFEVHQIFLIGRDHGLFPNLRRDDHLGTAVVVIRFERYGVVMLRQYVRTSAVDDIVAGDHRHSCAVRAVGRDCFNGQVFSFLDGQLHSVGDVVARSDLLIAFGPVDSNSNFVYTDGFTYIDGNAVILSAKGRIVDILRIQYAAVVHDVHGNVNVGVIAVPRVGSECDVYCFIFVADIRLYLQIGN